MQNLGASVARMLTPAARKRGFYEAQIWLRWAEIVPEHAAYCCPDKVFKDTLTLAVSSDSAKVILQMQQDILVQRINLFWGYQAVRRLKFVTKNLPPPKVLQTHTIQPSPQAEARAKARVMHIENLALRESFYKLAALVEQENENEWKNKT